MNYVRMIENLLFQIKIWCVVMKEKIAPPHLVFFFLVNSDISKLPNHINVVGVRARNNMLGHEPIRGQ